MFLSVIFIFKNYVESGSIVFVDSGSRQNYMYLTAPSSTTVVYINQQMSSSQAEFLNIFSTLQKYRVSIEAIFTFLTLSFW